ncbi:MAG: gamma-glutamyltransferase family protein [Alphaproteobacteria bacterium]|nr:gamma-glutamyltransferase family protein [Alphaproteobacteria bacterium]
MLTARQARRGMAVAPHHLAAEAGLRVLREGGGAVEAMVAMGAAIAVVYPHMTGIGGDGFWLIDAPGWKTPVAIDACGRAARLADIAFYRRRGHTTIPTRGPLAANTVAGAISGWQAALKLAKAKLGARLPLKRLLDDAIHWAEQGAPATASQGNYTARFLAELAPQPGFAQALLDQGRPPAAGTMRRMPELAKTLRQLARRGLDDFYRGELATAMAAEHERLGGPLRAADFRAHKAALVKPLSVALRAGTVFNLPPPTQGVSSLTILGLFERLGVAEAEGFDFVHGLVEATKQAFLWRNRHVADPKVMTADPRAELTAEALDRSAARIDRRRALPWPQPAAKGDTVWMTAADARGTVVSYIQSVYWEFGSGVVLNDSGVMWQNRGASFQLDPQAVNALAPGRKPFHTLNPALARLQDGRVMAYGTMGGEGQPQTQAMIFTRHVSYGQELQRAVTAPRWLLGRTWGQETTTLKLERRFPESLFGALGAAGHDVEWLPEWSDFVGHAHALVRHADGRLEGATDPRADGAAAGF